MAENTTIVINKKLRDKLKEYRVTKRESYDEIITRLCDIYDKVDDGNRKII